ncbi:hypothetical protein V6N12_028248 [Hibiscus sabdariffa]|uniref:Uncharacterized protein n=1 Tax=Hibiscus sabdariffa TaxID=183260 RepID=A0ABR2F5D0_9ROSI
MEILSWQLSPHGWYCLNTDASISMTLGLDTPDSVQAIRLILDSSMRNRSWFTEFIWIPRQRNMAANGMSRPSPLQLSVFSTAPDAMKSLLFRDVSGPPYHPLNRHQELVEGGGFFSSSASGYSKGLALLLLGQKHEDKSMRVSPWNHYQLVDREPDPDLQLASIKNRLPRGCASFVCFGRTSAGLDTPSHLKVGPVQQQDVLPGSFVADKSNDQVNELNNGNTNVRKVVLKSSLKKQLSSAQVSLEDVNDREASAEKDGDIPSHTEQRKVQWTDAYGSELAEIREFEPSETSGSDDEFSNGVEKTCACTIM